MTPRFMENIHLDIPKPITINHDEFGETECSVINKVLIQQVEEIEDKLLEFIRGMAIANGIDDVFVIDKKAVLSAIEKQIPKKPISTPDHHKHFCPTCHQPIKLGKKHCGSCGQKIGYGSDTE